MGDPPPTPSPDEDSSGGGGGGGRGNSNKRRNMGEARRSQFLMIECSPDEEAQLLSPGAFSLDYASDDDADDDVGARNTQDESTPIQSGLLAKFAARRVARRRRARSRRGETPSSSFPNGGDGGSSGLARLLTRLRLTGPRRGAGAHPHAISPLCPSLQSAPPRLLSALVPRAPHRAALLTVFLAVWAVLFAAALWAENAGDGALAHLDCVDALWARGDGCGLDGAHCRPFSNYSFAFRCPAGCGGVVLHEPRVVGPLSVVYRPLVVGSAEAYRGDSFLCAAAIHAGVVSHASGGCGVITRVGPAQGFRASTANGVESIPFDSYFPLAFTVTAAADTGIPCPAGSNRLPSGAGLLVLDLVFSVLLSVFTTSPSALFFPTFVALFAHVGLVSDPPGVSPRSTAVLTERFSTLAERLLPSLFIAVVLYPLCIRRTLGGGAGAASSSSSPPPAPQYEKTVLWLGFFWLGALSNLTLDWIPLSRLTAHDLAQQPGAKAALAIIVLLLALIAVQQAYHLWLEGRLPRLLAFYLLALAAIVVAVAALPGLELRLHHYILSLLLLPGTSMQTRPSLAYQGLLLGLLVNGAARWGLASVLETAAALRRDGVFGSAVPTLLAAPLIHSSGSSLSSISFRWAARAPPGVDGVSVLVNDVERHRAFFAEPDVGGATGGAAGFVWARQAGVDLPEYFRFAYVRAGHALDYTPPGVWNANRTWTPMEHYKPSPETRRSMEDAKSAIAVR